MILHWDQLVLYYGAEISRHRPLFEAAGQTTHALLCCRSAPDDVRLSSGSGEHAEDRILQSENWRVHLPCALANWTPLNNPIVVTLAINRSPCGSCARLLTNALNELHRQFPLRCEQNRFILASRGVYEDANMIAATRRSDLVRLLDAGWELCVLQVGSQLPARAQILLQGLEDLGQRGFVRLG
jgi:hypothetical protein